jgi:alkylation response protein AidB-like acyl-CoA dehydrogenase
MVADMATDCEAARLLTLEAAAKRDAGEPATRNVVMAKHFATEAAVRAARTAISLHGGVGYLGEYPVEGYLRDAIGLSLYEGTTQVQKLILGRDLLGVSAF